MSRCVYSVKKRDGTTNPCNRPGKQDIEDKSYCNQHAKTIQNKQRKELEKQSRLACPKKDSSPRILEEMNDNTSSESEGEQPQNTHISGQQRLLLNKVAKMPDNVEEPTKKKKGKPEPEISSPVPTIEEPISGSEGEQQINSLLVSNETLLYRGSLAIFKSLEDLLAHNAKIDIRGMTSDLEGIQETQPLIISTIYESFPSVQELDQLKASTKLLLLIMSVAIGRYCSNSGMMGPPSTQQEIVTPTQEPLQMFTE